MKTTPVLVPLLSLACGWAGYALACRASLREETTASRSTTAPVAANRPHPAGAPAAASQQEPTLLTLMRRTAARCDTASLWETLIHAEDSRHGTDPQQSAALLELYDREGPAALNHALALEDPAARRRWSAEFLSILAEKDAESALAIYQAHRSEFDEGWGGSAIAGLARQACGVSAESLLSTFQVSLGKDPCVIFNPLPSSYPADFDFRQVLDYLSDHSGSIPRGLPIHLASAWAGRHPADALDWLRDHPDGGVYHSFRAGETALQTIVNSPAPLRDEALLRLAQYPAQQRTAIWTAFSSPEGKVDPALLASATTMDSASAYLVPALATSRYSEALDPSWASVPVPQRQQAVAQVLTQWTQEDPSPVAAKARQRWLAMVESVR